MRLIDCLISVPWFQMRLGTSSRAVSASNGTMLVPLADQSIHVSLFPHVDLVGHPLGTHCEVALS